MKKMSLPPTVIAASALAISLLAAAQGQAQSFSEGFEHSEASLLSGNFANGHWSAGVEIRLAPGWKTYWRVPGESGVPPEFDWSASTNLSRIELGWPAPVRFADPGGKAIGYKNRVVFPLDVTPADPEKVVDLALDMRYAVCDEICVPVHAKLELKLDRNDLEAGLFQGDIDEARSQVPADAGNIEVSSLKLEKQGDGYDLLVGLSGADLVGGTDIIVEGPAAYYFGVPAAAGTDTWRIPVDGLDTADALKDKELTLTILSGESRLVRHVKVN